jgi:hypothetical protein
MSVIHDVLKNLDSMESARRTAGIPVFASDKPRLNWLWTVLGISVVLNIGIAVFYFWPVSTPPLLLPEDVFIAPVIAAEPALINANNSPAEATLTATEQTPAPENLRQDIAPTLSETSPALIPVMVSTPVQEKPPQQNTPTTSVAVVNQVPKKTVPAVHIEKTDSSKAMEKVLESVNNGSVVSAAKANQAMDANEHPVVRARLLMAANPDQVLPYLQRAVPDFMQDPDLLSIAAQSEQKQARHNAAIKFYQQLIHLQPTDARWRAGLAISLDALGNQRDALRLYELALGMGNLPPALANFVQKRITVIKV